jgi:hypothetical protein
MPGSSLRNEWGGRPLQAFTHGASTDIVVEQSAIEHSLVETVYLAFSQHRPLVLTPDAIWITWLKALRIISMRMLKPYVHDLWRTKAKSP